MTICCNASVLLTPCAIWNYMAQYVKMDDVVYKQEVDNVLHCRQKKTEPRSKTRCTGNSEKFSQVVFDTCEQTRQSKYFAPFPEAKLTLNDATLRAVGRNLRAVHTHAARCCAALLKNTRSVLPAQRSNAQRMCERPSTDELRKVWLQVPFMFVVISASMYEVTTNRWFSFSV